MADGNGSSAGNGRFHGPASLQSPAGSEAWLKTVTETVPDYICLLDRAGTILYITRPAWSLRTEDFLGTSIFSWTAESERPAAEARLRRVFEEGADEQSESATDFEGRTYWFNTRIVPLHVDGRVAAAVLVAHDITAHVATRRELQQVLTELESRVGERTAALQHQQQRLEQEITERTRTESALQESHARFHRLVNSQFIGIVIADADGGIHEANDAFLQMTGYDREALKQGLLNSGLLLSPRSRRRHARHSEQLRAKGHSAPWEAVLQTRDGKKIPALIGMTLLDAEGDKCLCVVIDILRQKRAERKLLLEERLLRKQLNLREMERKLLAYDLHDGLVQDVVGAKMLLDAILHQADQDDRFAEQAPLGKKLRLAGERLGKAIDEGRRLIGQLRPMILDEQGIVAAIEYLINELEKAFGLRVRFSHDLSEERFAPLLENTVFRVVQEGLTNVHRHSGVRSAEVLLRQTRNHLELSISDRGIGFDKAAVSESRFGLHGIRERAKMFGGRAVINSRPGGGTRIKARFALEAEPSRRKKAGRRPLSG